MGTLLKLPRIAIYHCQSLLSWLRWCQVFPGLLMMHFTELLTFISRSTQASARVRGKRFAS
uniref:Uncharacterized protein n=1 Tax=Rhizophora mucronata TaxID=61149 RepID=A0A2P2Q8B7_RHIMU